MVGLVLLALVFAFYETLVFNFAVILLILMAV